MHVLPKYPRATMLVAAAAAGITVLSGCAGTAQTPAAGGGSVTYGVADSWPENLFPYIAAGNTTTVQDLLGRVLPSAFIVQPDFTVQYDRELLADEPQNSVVGGHQTTVYHLNPAAAWSDGTAISADDFAYTWHVSTTPDQGGCDGTMSTAGLEDISSVTGSDDGRTVTVTYAAPFADWQSLFSGSQPLLPAHLMAVEDAAQRCATFDAGWEIADGKQEDDSDEECQLKKITVDVASKRNHLAPSPMYRSDVPTL